MNPGFVWMVAWPDFRARSRRFLVTGVGMALVLSITLLLSAFAEGFTLRAQRLVGVFAGDEYIVAEGSSGPMTSTVPVPVDLVTDATGTSSATIEPIFLRQSAIEVQGSPVGVVVVATDVGAGPRIIEGRGIEGQGEAVVDAELDELSIGDELVLAGEPLTVVGVTEDATWDIANAGLFIERGQALDALAGGSSVATAFVVRGVVDQDALPDGLEVQTPDDAIADVVHRTSDAKHSIDAFTYTLWVLAVVIVGAVLYLAALERTRDFAVFKATGASTVDLVLGLAVQAALLGVVAGVISIGLAHLMKPVYPGLLSLPVSVAWPVVPVAVVISVLSSMVGIRRAIRVDPSQAFG